MSKRSGKNGPSQNGKSKGRTLSGTGDPAKKEKPAAKPVSRARLAGLAPIDYNEGSGLGQMRKKLKEKVEEKIEELKEEKDDDEPAAPLKSVDMDYDDVIRKKRNTELGNTLFLKAEEGIVEEQRRIQQSFLNPQQLAIYKATKKNSEADERWYAEVTKVKMMTEMLKCNLLEVNKEMSKLFKQNYNFVQQYGENTFAPQPAKPKTEMTEAEKKQLREEKLAMFSKDQPEPWGWWFKAVPDSNNNFRIEDLPPETFEPPPSPRGELRQQINNLTADIHIAIRNKHYQKLQKLIKLALQVAPTELEYIICHAQFAIKQYKDKMLKYVDVPGITSSSESESSDSGSSGDLAAQKRASQTTDPEQKDKPKGDTQGKKKAEPAFKPDRVRPDYSAQIQTAHAEEGLLGENAFYAVPSGDDGRLIQGTQILQSEHDKSNAMPVGHGTGAKRGLGVGGKLGRELAQEQGEEIVKKLMKVQKDRMESDQRRTQNRALRRSQEKQQT